MVGGVGAQLEVEIGLVEQVHDGLGREEQVGKQPASVRPPTTLARTTTHDQRVSPLGLDDLCSD